MTTVAVGVATSFSPPHLKMAADELGRRREDFVYRVSTAAEWDELQNQIATHGGDLDRSTGCIHLSDHSQVKMVLRNFFRGREDLFLLQIDAAKLGDGLVYEAIDETTSFPHFYGPSRSFTPLRLDTVTKVEKLKLVDGEFTCDMLDDLPS